MDQLIWILIVIVLIVIGIVLFFIELETDEIEVFGPFSIVFLVSGVIIWFIINSQNIIGTPEIFLFLSIVIVAIPCIIIIFTIFLIKKVRNISETPSVVNMSLEGKEAVCAEDINSGSTGYIRYKSELWKAKAKLPILKGQKVHIYAQDNLTVFVEPEGSPEILHCPNCGRELNPNTLFCGVCGSKL
jgi:membrane-bound ClpP family serine protease